MITNKLSYLTGYYVGCKLREGLARKPVAYLYNGMQLPPFPEWHRSFLPGAAIVIDEDGVTPIMVLYYYKSTAYDGNNTFRGPFMRYRYKNGAWTQVKGSISDFSTFSYKVASHNIVWSNADIYDNNGELIISASDPIPVYDSPNPTQT